MNSTITTTIKPQTKTKKITCLQCDTVKQGEDNTIPEHENCWWICDTCEDEVAEKLNCFNFDTNYNL
ncbi:MAG: hypothetical protein HOI47_29205 [Candidatus Scalindua sp.]|jgi:hypothetical protein|nr:hypothetical protein [Candidatus Scalindua sp.]